MFLSMIARTIRPRYYPPAPVPLTMAFSVPEVFATAVEAGAAPAQQTFRITPVGNTPPVLAGPAAAVTADVDDILDTVAVVAGPIVDGLQTYDVQVNYKAPGALPPSTYSATIEVTDADATDSPRTITARMQVTASSGTTVVPLKSVRFRGSTGTGLARGFATLPTGASGGITASELSKLSIWDVSGAPTELQAYFEIPTTSTGIKHRPHADGTIRIVNFQFNHVSIAPDTPMTGRYELRIGPTRGTTDLTKDPLSNDPGFPSAHPTWNQPQNQAVHELWKFGYPNIGVWPENVADLQAADLFFPMNSRAHDLALGGTAARWTNDYIATRNNKWAFWDDAQQGNGTAPIKDAIMSLLYYDRPFGVLAQFFKSSDHTDLMQGSAYAWQWVYGVAKTSPGYQHPEGWGIDLERMYCEGAWIAGLLWGDNECLMAPKYAAEMSYADYADLTESGWGSQASASQDQRTMSNSMRTWLTAWRAGFDTVVKGGPRSVTGRIEEMMTIGLEGLDALNNDPCYQTAAGNMQFMWNLPNVNACLNKPNPFMIGGLQGEMLASFKHWYPADSRVTTALQRVIDWHLNAVFNLVGGGTGTAYSATGGLNGAGGIRYTFCVNEGNSLPAPDLTGLFLVTFGDAARELGGTYVTVLQNLYDGGRSHVVSTIRGDGDKIFNQSIRASYAATYDLGL